MKTGAIRFSGVACMLFLFLPMLAHAMKIGEICPKYAQDPEYRQIIDYYGYRLQSAVGSYGCDVLSVYYALGKDKNGNLLALVDENDDLMKVFIDLLAGKPDLARMLANNPALMQALGQSVVEKDSSAEHLLARLKNLNSEQIQIISSKRPAASALAMLIPNLSAKMLSSIFSSSELETLLPIVAMTALVSAAANADEIPVLMPYFTTNPNDALQVYKHLMRIWGQTELQNILLKNEGVIPALVPPLSSEQMRDYDILNWTPTQFHRMQTEYISIMRDVYKKAEREYGPAWAREICLAFADSLAAALLTATPAEQDKIRRFLLGFIGNETLFKKIFLPSGCFQTNNVALFGNFLNVMSKAGSLAYNTQLLTELADWFDSGQLSGMFGIWLRDVDARKFSLALDGVGKDDEDLIYSAFLGNLCELAMYRAMLAPEQKELLDYLLQTLPGPKENPVLVLTFLNSVKRPLFETLQPGRFLHPREVALHLLEYGYPESSDPGLYQYYLLRNAQGQMPAAGEAILQRGSLPEGELLKHGQTFADRHGGYSVEDMVDMADTVLTVGLALSGTIATGGAGMPVLLVATGKVASKQAAKAGVRQAARQMARNVVRDLAKDAARAPKFARPLLTTGVKKLGGVLVKGAEKAPKTTLVIGNALPKVKKACEIYDWVQAGRYIYSLLGGAGLMLDLGVHDEESLCPGNIAE